MGASSYRAIRFLTTRSCARAAGPFGGIHYAQRRRKDFHVPFGTRLQRRGGGVVAGTIVSMFVARLSILQGSATTWQDDTSRIAVKLHWDRILGGDDDFLDPAMKHTGMPQVAPAEDL